MHTTPLWADRDEDLHRAIHAVDPEERTAELPVAAPVHETAVLPPAPPETMVLPPVLVAEPKRTLVLAAVGAVVGLGLLALLVALVVHASNSSTTIVRPPVTPITKTATAQVVTPSSVTPPVPPPPVAAPPPTAVRSAQRMAPAPPPPAEQQRPIRERLHQVFPRLFP
ncbi:MAG TPA: hypothetical protein PKI77_01105 [Mycobacterium sp.]|nr:hypothetical protein [Mycobacterium sp.]